MLRRHFSYFRNLSVPNIFGMFAYFPLSITHKIPNKKKIKIRYFDKNISGFHLYKEL